MRRRNVDVANEYAGESDFATRRSSFSDPLRSKDKQSSCCQECRDFVEPVPFETTCQAEYIGMSMGKSIRAA